MNAEVEGIYFFFLHSYLKRCRVALVLPQAGWVLEARLRGWRSTHITSLFKNREERVVFALNSPESKRAGSRVSQ